MASYGLGHSRFTYQSNSCLLVVSVQAEFKASHHLLLKLCPLFLSVNWSRDGPTEVEKWCVSVLFTNWAILRLHSLGLLRFLFLSGVSHTCLSYTCHLSLNGCLKVCDR